MSKQKNQSDFGRGVPSVYFQRHNVPCEYPIDSKCFQCPSTYISKKSFIHSQFHPSLPRSNLHNSIFGVLLWPRTNKLIQKWMVYVVQFSNTKPCSVPTHFFDNKNSSYAWIRTYQKIFPSKFRCWFCSGLLVPCVSYRFAIRFIKFWIV